MLLSYFSPNQFALPIFILSKDFFAPCVFKASVNFSSVKQHSISFLPLPQVQGSFRPIQVIRLINIPSSPVFISVLGTSLAFSKDFIILKASSFFSVDFTFHWRPSG